MCTPIYVFVFRVNSCSKVIIMQLTSIKLFWLTQKIPSGFRVFFSACLGFIHQLKPWSSKSLQSLSKDQLREKCKRISKKVPCTFVYQYTREHCEGHHQHVEKTEDHSVITKNRMSLWNLQKTRQNLTRNIKGAAGVSNDNSQHEKTIPYFHQSLACHPNPTKSPQIMWRNVVWSDETESKRYNNSIIKTERHVWSKKKNHIIKRTSHARWSMVVAASPAFLQPELGHLSSWTELWIASNNSWF